MEVHFTPELEAKLTRSAAQQGRNPGELVRELVSRYFDEEIRFIEAADRGALTQEEQDRWLLENQNAINAKIRLGIDQLDSGEGIPEDRLDDYLVKLKAHPE